MSFFEFKIKKIFQNRKINNNLNHDIEPQDIFLDNLIQKKEVKTEVIDQKIEVPLAKKVFQCFCLVVLILIGVLWGTTVYLQTFRHKEFFLLAERNKIRTHLVRPERGVIYDSSMRQMVFNRIGFDLIFDKRDFPWKRKKISDVLEKIGPIIKKDSLELKEIIQENDSLRVLVAENLDHQSLILLKTRIQELPGFTLEENAIRYYKKGEYFSHIIGHMGRINREELRIFEGYSITDYIGRTGIERFYENILRGRAGNISIKKDAFGNKLSEQVILDSVAGSSLVLWLDMALQEKITKELKNALERTGAEVGAVIALDPTTGGVLAKVSLPNFDNNLFAKGISQEDWREILDNPNEPLFNRAISGNYSTGSVIKPFIAAAALEEEIITSDTTIHCDGVIEIPHQYDPGITFYFRDWRIGGLGIVDVYKAIADSSNLFFYIIGGGYRDFTGLGVERIEKYLRFFSWGERTGIDLPMETRGLVPNPEWKMEQKGEAWFLGNTYFLSIGQQYVLASPIQVAIATGAIANNSYIFQPQIVNKIVDKQKNLVKDIEPVIINQDFISPKNIDIIKRGMRQTVTDGTATMLNHLPIKVAAKTGTAQTPMPGFYHKWITVFAPYENPEIVLTIMVESVEGIQLTTLPVAKSVLEWYFNQHSKTIKIRNL